MLDANDQVELLCYLVVNQIVSLALTGVWMRPDQCVVSIRIWLDGNRAQAHWSEHLCLADFSKNVAADFAIKDRLPARTALSELFAQTWMLDYRSSVVRQVHDACAHALDLDTR